MTKTQTQTQTQTQTLGWGRRPLELATLRLQNLADVQFANYDELKPVDDRCITQLGGCAVVDASGEVVKYKHWELKPTGNLHRCDHWHSRGTLGEAIYSWLDQGLCDIPDFLDVLQALE